MRRALLLIGLAAFWLGGLDVRGISAAPSAPPVQIQNVVFSGVSDWQRGTRQDLLISNNAGGELRLNENATQGVFTSDVITSTGVFHAVGAVWRADSPAGTRLTLELRGGPGPNQLGNWQQLPAGDARSQADDGALALESVRIFPAKSRFVQLRATFNTSATNASPILNEITLFLIDATAGPARTAGLARVPVMYGPPTLTTPPQVIQRRDWNASAPVGRSAREMPRGIIIHQIGNDGVDNPLPFLRALAAYHTEVLKWDDLAFHFIVDQDGNVFEGRTGGPAAVIPRLASGDTAVHVALIGNDAPTSAALVALTNLLAWLGQAYQIEPAGQHQLQAANGTAVSVPNIVAHSELVRTARDPSAVLRDLMPNLRQNVDQATIRSRWYFAEGNVFSFAQRLAVQNPTAAPATVRFILLRQPGPAVVREATLPPDGRVDLVVNSVFSDTTDVPAIVESNSPVIAERYMDFGGDITATAGVSQLSRVWYFAEGSTEAKNQTYLVLFNPQTAEVSAKITYMKNDGVTAEQSVRIPPLQRIVVIVADSAALRGTGFGARVIATRPIVAERTIILASDGDAKGGALTSPGIPALSRRWYFAEGTTSAPFQMSLLVLNPNAQRSDVAVTFMTPDGTSLTRRYAIPPTTRLAINVNEVVPDLGVATSVESDRPVAVERAMYWRDNAVGTASPGATAPAYTWRFADGRTSGDFQQYMLISNPNKNQARVTFDFVLSDGKHSEQSVIMPGNSRYTMAVHQLYPGQQAIAATVRSTQPIVAERSLYVGSPDLATNRGGATTLGVPEMTDER